MQFRPITRALLAYDGSQRAAAAMREAAELAAALKLPLAVVHVGKDDSAAQKVIEEARRYLTAYAIECEFLVRTGYANETILDVMAEQAYDLLFIGAYGHSRIIEMVLGSTTEYVLRNSASPLFLCR